MKRTGPERSGAGTAGGRNGAGRCRAQRVVRYGVTGAILATERAGDGRDDNALKYPDFFSESVGPVRAMPTRLTITPRLS